MIKAWCSAALFAALLISGCESSKKEKRPVSEVTKTMRTQCIGRHLIDLPDSFRLLHRGSSATLYFGRDENFTTVEIQVVGESIKLDQFEAVIKQRSAEIAAEKNESTKSSMLLLEERVDTGVFLLRYQKSDISNRSHIHELHILISGVQILLKEESYEGAFGPVEERLKKLAAQLSVVADSQRTGSGFCIGPVVINADNDYEMGAFYFRDGNGAHRDVNLSIDLNTFKQDENEPRLIQRAGRNFIALGFSPDVLRKGKVQLAGTPAEEWIARHNSEGRTEHILNIESYPTAPTLSTPVLQMQMETGGAIPTPPASGLPPYLPSNETVVPFDPAEVSSSLSDDEVIEVWDAIVKSMRPRPGAVKSQSK